MGQFYRINMDGDTMTVGFGDPATNTQIVNDALGTLGLLKANEQLAGGPLLKVNGAASMPVSFTIAHAVTHLYGAVAVWDPKLQKYVVSVSHNPDYAVGDQID